MGGQIDRHPQHHTVWTAVAGLFAALWAGLVFATASSAAHDLGWASLVIAAYVVATFFLPLPLLPIRDERKVALRRAEREKQLQMTIASLSAAVARLNDPVAGPQVLAPQLVAECSALISAAWEGKTELSTEQGSGDVQTANAFLKKTRPILASYYSDEMYRVDRDIPEGASADYVAKALSNALPALHNFQNRYPA